MSAADAHRPLPERGYRGSGFAGQPVDRNPGAAARIPPDDRREGLRLRLSGLAWNVAWEAVRALPEPVAFGLARAAAGPMRLVARTQRAQVRRNLARVVPDATADELDDLVVAAFRSYTRYFVEAFRAADLSAAAVHARTTTAGFDHLDAALERGRGVIVLLAHHGSWDVAARWAESHRYHLAVVAEIVRPRALFEKFVRLREADGLAQVLAADHLVGLLSDRDLTGTAPIVPLFGHPARIPYGPVVLSRRTGAAVVPITMVQRPGRRWHLEVFPELDVSAGSVEDGCAALAEGIERIVRFEPAQWHAFSPVWLADVPAHRRGEVPPEVAARIDGAAGGEPAA